MSEFIKQIDSSYDFFYYYIKLSIEKNYLSFKYIAEFTNYNSDLFGNGSTKYKIINQKTAWIMVLWKTSLAD